MNPPHNDNDCPRLPAGRGLPTPFAGLTLHGAALWKGTQFIAALPHTPRQPRLQRTLSEQLSILTRCDWTQPDNPAQQQTILRVQAACSSPEAWNALQEREQRIRQALEHLSHFFLHDPRGVRLARLSQQLRLSDLDRPRESRERQRHIEAELQATRTRRDVLLRMEHSPPSVRGHQRQATAYQVTRLEDERDRRRMAGVSTALRFLAGYQADNASPPTPLPEQQRQRLLQLKVALQQLTGSPDLSGAYTSDYRERRSGEKRSESLLRQARVRQQTWERAGLHLCAADPRSRAATRPERLMQGRARWKATPEGKETADALARLQGALGFKTATVVKRRTQELWSQITQGRAAAEHYPDDLLARALLISLRSHPHPEARHLNTTLQPYARPRWQDR